MIQQCCKTFNKVTIEPNIGVGALVDVSLVSNENNGGKEHCLQRSTGCKNLCQEVLLPLNLLWDVVRLFLVQASEREYLERDRLGATGDLWGPSIKTHSLSSESSLDLSGEVAAANFLSRFTGATERDAPTLTCSSTTYPTLTC